MKTPEKLFYTKYEIFPKIWQMQTPCWGAAMYAFLAKRKIEINR